MHCMLWKQPLKFENTDFIPGISLKTNKKADFKTREVLSADMGEGFTTAVVMFWCHIHSQRSPIVTISFLFYILLSPSLF